jgi:fatty-acyl-CoA synthase
VAGMRGAGVAGARRHASGLESSGYVGDWMGRAAAYWPERLAVVDPAAGGGVLGTPMGAPAVGADRAAAADAGRFTYADMDGRARGLAGWLRRAGVERGDRVGVLARNRVEFLDAFFACGKLGAVLVPWNWRLHPVELAALATRTRPAVLLYDGEFQPGAAAIAEAAAPRLLHLDGDGLTGSRPYGEAMAAPPLAASEPGLTEEDTACLLFTGGTTGQTRAARISYRMIAWNILNTVIHELERDDVTITHTPMFHTGGLLVYTLPLLTLGGTVVLMRAWDPAAMLDLVERERVTMFFCVPTQYQLMLASERFGAADLSSLRFVTSGGAPLPVSLIERWRAVHDVPFKQGFGMTEFGPGIFSMGPEHAVAKAGSIGRPNWFVRAAVVDDDGRRLGAGEVGELVLAGPSMFSGYFEDEAATAAAIDADGWFHTGDLARVDEDGFYFIVDRKKDMYVSGGENVYPAEVERALSEHPAVLLCAVVGVPDDRWGEVGRAFVVLRSPTRAGGEAAAASQATGGTGAGAATAGDAVGEDDLLGFLRERLASYKVPASIRFVAELPMSPQGKILRRALR